MVDGRREPEGGRCEGEIRWEPHLALEIAAVVHGVFVEHHDADVPEEDVVVIELYVEGGDSLFGVGEFFELSLQDGSSGL